MYSGLPWHNIRLILTEKSPSVAVIVKNNMTLPTQAFQFSAAFSQNTTVVLTHHVCSFTSSVCFRPRWLGLISSFYPLQFWWGPKCLLSSITKGNPHKLYKALKKLRAELSESLLSQTASSPRAALPWVQWQLCKEKEKCSPQILLALHVWKNTLTQTNFSVFAPCLREFIDGISRADCRHCSACIIYR